MNSERMERTWRLLDRPAWKPIHTRITLALGIGWMLDAFEVTIIGNVLGILKEIWHITSSQASLLVSVWLVGIMIGALLFGYLADRFGRRRLFILTLLLYSGFTLVSALSPGYYWFLLFRLLTAIGVGAEYSAVNAAIGELIPARFRGRAGAAVMSFWPVGAILAAIVSLYFISALPDAVGWRVAFAIGAIMGLFTLWARKVLPESPRWLARRGRVSEASSQSERIVANVADFSEAAGPAPETSDEADAGFFPRLAALARRHPGRLVLGCLLDFSEASGYYGLFAILPLIVMPMIHLGNAQVPWFFIIGNVGAAVGGGVAAILLDRVGRKVTVTGFYVLAASSMLYMGAATIHGDVSGVLVAFVVANFCATGSWIAAYPTFSEIFPTESRATGIGFSVAFGRIGAALAPPVLVALAEQLSVMAAFGVLAALWLIGALAMIPWVMFGPEGRGRALEAMAPE